MGWHFDPDSETDKTNSESLEDVAMIKKPASIVTTKKLSYIEKLENLRGLRILYQDVIVAGDVRNAIVERFPGATFSLAPWQEQRKGGGKEIPPLVPKESPPESWSTGNRVGPRGEGAGSINQEIDRERESDV
ncbi:hypothetical protein B296_00046849 [Ensete ventricosum]|uniref:Uncharacterized protein n=1 Tax=Ensete ventricosum TaxID=4639 RepID=A0A426X569_ENSVE|nr:hypothetical protein B296_00046849 [Ensete ventricosum]